MHSDELSCSLALLHCLSNQEFRSGESIANRLGISRAAVWKRVSKLSELGIEVERSKRRGYRLAREVDLLDLEIIRDAVDRLVAHPPRVFVLPACASTNTHLLNELRRGDVVSPAVLLVEMQTAGRGRRGRAWASPFGRNIYLSYSWRCDRGVASLSGLSLAIGVLVADALDAATGLEVKLKWPNDLLLGSEKCGGILIDVDGDLEGAVDVIIGIGINVDMAGVDAPQIAQPWTDLNAHTPAPVSRNKIASGVIAALQMGIAQFQEGGFTLFRDRWLARDALAGMPISVSGVGQTLDGLAMGVSVTGGLLIRAGMHTIEVNSGDVSVRLQ